MSQQPQPPTEGDDEFERKVQEKLATQEKDGTDEDATDVAQEDHKSEVPELEENEESPVDPGSV